MKTQQYRGKKKALTKAERELPPIFDYLQCPEQTIYVSSAEYQLTKEGKHPYFPKTLIKPEKQLKKYGQK